MCIVFIQAVMEVAQAKLSLSKPGFRTKMDGVTHGRRYDTGGTLIRRTGVTEFVTGHSFYADDGAFIFLNEGRLRSDHEHFVLAVFEIWDENTHTSGGMAENPKPRRFTFHTPGKRMKKPRPVISWSTVAALVSRSVSNIWVRLLTRHLKMMMKSHCALKQPWVRLLVCVRWFLSRRKYLTPARNWFTKGLCFLSCFMGAKHGFCRKSL